MRALFVEHSQNLKSGTYIFVAKQSIVEIEFDKLANDFQKIIYKSYAFKEKPQ